MITKEEIIGARRGAVTIATLSDEDWSDALVGTIKYIYAMKGYSVADGIQGEVELIAKYVSRVRGKYPNLTLGEIRLAWENGVTGEYGADRRLNMSNFMSWLNTYVVSDIRRDAVVGMMKEQRDTARLLSMADAKTRNEESVRRQLKRSWEHYKESRALPGDLLNGMAGAMYDELVRLGKLNATDTSISEARRRVSERPKARGVAEAIANMGGYEMAVKRELLSMYFGSLVARGVELRI